MSERNNIMNRLSTYGRPKTSEPITPRAPEPTPKEEPVYDANWLPTGFDSNVPLPPVKINALQTRLDLLAIMKPGDSFSLPAHLADLYRASALKLRKQRPEMKNSRFVVRSQNELFSRMWRVS